MGLPNAILYTFCVCANVTTADLSMSRITPKETSSKNLPSLTDKDITVLASLLMAFLCTPVNIGLCQYHHKPYRVVPISPRAQQNCANITPSPTESSLEIDPHDEEGPLKGVMGPIQVCTRLASSSSLDAKVRMYFGLP